MKSLTVNKLILTIALNYSNPKKLLNYENKGVLKEVMDKAVANTSAVELCAFGDQRIAEETEKVFKKEKNIKKGESSGESTISIFLEKMISSQFDYIFDNH